MKFIIPLKEFFSETKIEYKEDIWNEIWCDYIKYDAKDIEHNLPKAYSHITEDMIKENDELKDALNRALNRASESAFADACYTEQQEAVSEYADTLVNYINNIKEGAIKSIVIDFVQETATITGDAKKTADVIRQIIEGEGMFDYQGSTKEFVRSLDGSDNYIKAVEAHTHYLLNAKLIDDIWGFSGTPKFEWDCQYGDVNDEYFSEYIEEELSEIPGRAKDKIEKITKDIATLPTK